MGWLFCYLVFATTILITCYYPQEMLLKERMRELNKDTNKDTDKKTLSTIVKEGKRLVVFQVSFILGLFTVFNIFYIRSLLEIEKIVVIQQSYSTWYSQLLTILTVINIIVSSMVLSQILYHLYRCRVAISHPYKYERALTLFKYGTDNILKSYINVQMPLWFINIMMTIVGLFII